MLRKPLPITLFAPFLGGIGAVVLAVLCHYRLLPFLKDDTILSAGRNIPTEDFARGATTMFLLFAPICFLMGIIQYFYWRRKSSKDKT
jgi:hypothetical protein